MMVAWSDWWIAFDTRLCTDGDVIITITLFGKVSIELVKNPEIESQYLPAERPNTKISEGEAYAIWSKARWKAKHDAIVEPSELAIEGLINQVARVGLTFRYVRRSFLEIAAKLPLSIHQRPPRFRPLDVVDARVYNSQGRAGHAYLYTYPAIILQVDEDRQELTLQYVSDGLVADSDKEAQTIAEGVPFAEAKHATPVVKNWVQNENAAWTKCTFDKLMDIRTRGPEAILDEWRRCKSR